MSRESTILKLTQASPAVLPSLLLCDFGNLEREVAALEAAGVQALHLDVMDGNFVPNLTYGMPIVAALRRLTALPLDVHLMISNPGRYIPQFIDAGSDVITFHVEAVDDARPILEEIRANGIAAGVAINPSTPLTEVEHCLDKADLVLAMSVEAGFGGQAFHPESPQRLRRLRAMTSEETLLEVDGGVNLKTISACTEAGAQLLVVGSAIFNTDDYRAAVGGLQHSIAGT